MKKKIVLGSILGIIALGVLGCSMVSSKLVDADEKTDRIKVMTSIYPIKEFAQIIGRDKVNVSSMVPEGAEPHDFEPKARDMVELSKSQIFIYNGLNMEHWIDDVLNTVKSDNLEIVNTSVNTKVILAGEDEHSDDGHNHAHHEKEVSGCHDHGREDPHIWLSLTESKNQAKLIEEALIKADPQNKDYYSANYEKFASELDQLNTEYAEKFKNIANKDFITGHAAFGYLCRDLGLNQKSVEDVFGEGEVTPKHLKEIADYAKENNIKVVFMPDSASEKLSKTLANEVGAKVVKISSLETKNGDKSYLETMKENLDTIYNNLK